MNGPHHRKTTYSALKLLAELNNGSFSINGVTLVKNSKNCIEEQSERQADLDSTGTSLLEEV
ncbi:hypothetical protein [Fibrobacter sp. UWB11]|uniref:hypothetical protein n=1 Tax=Fibrobacter sp. UWB11 TaxID=1896202 RepID=UPI00092A107C|nr:hypothetical protein [Fibrobacter sp. UWB11]SIN96189.1 hypothetical protein SAMN05720758_0770 [Fibrobacter sp. UWB11]